MPGTREPVVATKAATIDVANHTSKTVLFEVAGAKPGHTFGELQAYFAAEHQRALKGVSLEGPPDFKFTVTESDVPPDGTTTLTLPTAAGTYGITCVYQTGRRRLMPSWSARSRSRPSSFGSGSAQSRPPDAQSGNASGPRSLSSRASPEASSAGSHEYG